MRKSILFTMVLTLSFFVLCALCPVQAEVRISPAAFKAKNINLKNFALLGLSGDGQVLTGIEKISDPLLIQKGFSHKFWIFDYPSDEKATPSCSEVLLPINDFQQSWLSFDGKKNLVTANKGATFLLVDIPSRKVTVLFDHKKGTPGFRSSVGNIEYFDGKYYVWGYFYNEKDEKKSEGLAEVDLSKSGPDMFRMSQSTEEIMKQKPWYTEWVGPQQCFLLKRKKQGIRDDSLIYFDKGTSREIEKIQRILHEASAAGRCVYTCVDPASKENNVLYAVNLVDAVSGKKWKIASSPVKYENLFIARDKGDTILLSVVNLKANKMSIFYAMEKDNFALKPIPSLQNRQLNVMRLARYGKAYASFSGTEIIWGKLE
jgi:hypothetical protein